MQKYKKILFRPNKMLKIIIISKKSFIFFKGIKIIFNCLHRLMEEVVILVH